MHKICFLFVLLLALCVSTTFSQKKHASKTEFLKNAPARVQEYYRVFDSLANPTWSGWAYEKWSLDELKKYANMVYDANEYEPIEKRKYDHLRYNAAKKANIGYITYDIDVINEIKKRVSEKHAQIIDHPYWLKIVVDDIVTLPYILKEDPNAGFIEKRIKGRVTEVWKGKKYNINDEVTCYYLTFWNYSGLVKGNSYIVALYPIIDDDASDEVKYALGGYEGVEKSVFPIDNGYVVDEDNLFGLGKRVEVVKFTEALSSTINQIKSWRVDEE